MRRPINSDKRVDLALLWASGLVALVSGAILLFDVSLFVRAPARGSSDQVIAKLDTVHKDVRRRPRDMPVWGDARVDEALHSKDYVFTDKGSAAVLAFLDKTQIELGENTLIVLEKAQDRQVLNVIKGTLRAKAPAAGGALAPNVAIKIGGRDEIVEAKPGAELALKVDKSGKAELTVLSGKAEVKARPGAKATVIETNQRAKLTEGAAPVVAAVAVRLVAPADGARLGDEAKAGVALAWKGPAGTAHVEVATDDGFGDVVDQGDAQSPARRTAVLPPGIYYWRVTAGDETSPPSKFVVERRTGPELYQPANGQSLTWSGGDAGLPVALTWEALPDAQGYDVEVAGDPGFAAVKARLTPGSAGAKTPPLAAGTYSWRARARGGAWSRTGTFAVAALPALTAPVGQAPENGLSVLAGTAVPLSWNTTDGAHSYGVEIATAPDGPAASTRDVKGTAWTWTPSAPGTYYWRVKSRDAYGRISPPGAPRLITVVAPSSPPSGGVQGGNAPGGVGGEAPGLPAPAAIPSPQPPPPQAPPPTLDAPVLPSRYDIQLPSNTRTSPPAWWHVLFESTAYGEAALPTSALWPPVTGATSYVVEIARDGEFAKILLRDQVTAPAWYPHDLPPGEYFIRVTAIGKDAVLSPVSNVAELGIHPAPGPSAPKRFKPTDGEALSVAVKEPVVSLSWSKVEAATTYSLQIARDEDFEEVAYEHHNRGTDANVILKPGTYYWRVRAHRRDLAGEWSTAWRFSVEHVIPEPPPEAQAPAQAPLELAPTPAPAPAAPAPAPAPAPEPQPALPVAAEKSLIHPDNARISGAIAPTLLHYQTMGAATPTVIDATLFDSFIADGTFKALSWLSPELNYQRTATILFRKPRSTDPPGQGPVAVHPSVFTGALRLVFSAFEVVPGVEVRGAVRFHSATDSRISAENAQLVGPSLGLAFAPRLSESWHLRVAAAGSSETGPGTIKAAHAGWLRASMTYDLALLPIGIDFGFGLSRVAQTFRDDGRGDGTGGTESESTIHLGLGLDL